MKEQTIAKAYATALMQLGEDGKLDVAHDMTVFQDVINHSNDLENVLFLELFTIDEKKLVFKDVAAKMGMAPLLEHSILYLMEERRIGLLPLIYKELMVMDDHQKGFIRGEIEGASKELVDDVRHKILAYVQKQIGQKPELVYKSSADITAGYRVTVGDFQLDATLDHQLNEFKKMTLLGE